MSLWIPTVRNCFYRTCLLLMTKTWCLQNILANKAFGVLRYPAAVLYKNLARKEPRRQYYSQTSLLWYRLMFRYLQVFASIGYRHVVLQHAARLCGWNTNDWHHLTCNLRLCVRACVCECACLRACVRARVCVCVRARGCTRVLNITRVFTGVYQWMKPGQASGERMWEWDFFTHLSYIYCYFKCTFLSPCVKGKCSFWCFVYWWIIKSYLI